MLRVLLMDSYPGQARDAACWLTERHEFEVVHEVDPLDACGRLEDQAFDAVVCHLKAGQQAEAFLRRVEQNRVNLLTETEFIVSGLTTLEAAARIGRRPGGGRPGLVVWSTGEASRGLQMRFARETLGATAFCHRQSPRERLWAAIRHAVAGQMHIDTALEVHLTEPGTGKPRRPVAKLYDRTAWASIWPAAALGGVDRHTVARIAGIPAYKCAEEVGKMKAEVLNETSPTDTSSEGRKTAMTYVHGFASVKREFFLDAVVLRTYPPEHASGLRRKR